MNNSSQKKKISSFAMNNQVLYRNIKKSNFQKINKVQKNKLQVSGNIVRRQRNGLDDLI